MWRLGTGMKKKNEDKKLQLSLKSESWYMQGGLGQSITPS